MGKLIRFWNFSAMLIPIVCSNICIAAVSCFVVGLFGVYVSVYVSVCVCVSECVCVCIYSPQDFISTVSF